MASRSLNRVLLIGNLTRDPELRYTPQGTAVCTFGLATNRSWVTESGERREETEFHRIVAWNKLAEICSQFLAKGRRTYVEGRLQTRQWTTQDGSPRQTTEVVINEMIILDSRRSEPRGVAKEIAESSPEEFTSEEAVAEEKTPKTKSAKEEKSEGVKKTLAKGVSAKKKARSDDKKKVKEKEEVTEDEIPF